MVNGELVVLKQNLPKNSYLCTIMNYLVTKSTGSWYTVLQNGDPNSTPLKARLRGSLRLNGANSTAPVVVGDFVQCVENTQGELVIDSVEERKNYLVRKATNLSRQKHIIAANIDTLYVVISLMNPETSLEFVDRVLAAAEAFGVEAKLVVNKIDIAAPTQEFLEIYEIADYEIFQTSTITGDGIEELRKEVQGKTVLFTGNSGVGKSSLLCAIDPTLDVKTGEISEYHKTGKHTTTFSEIFQFAGGGFLIDTPGIKGFGLVDVAREELYHYFREIMAHSEGCGFYNCTHTHEPKCAVIDAVENGLISQERYFSYCKMMAEDAESTKYR